MSHKPRPRSKVAQRACAFALCIVASLLGASLFLAGSAFALNPERHYEMVSPVFKGGYGAKTIDGVQADGESVMYSSFGFFDGLQSSSTPTYQASRLGGGWATVPLNPPTSLSQGTALRGISPSLDGSLWDFILNQPNYGRSKSNAAEHQWWVRTATGFRPAGPILKNVTGTPFEFLVEGTSNDFCTIFLNNGGVLLSNAVGAANQLYEVSAGCHGEGPALRVVALNNSGGLLSPDCAVSFGTLSSQEAAFNVNSTDGSEAFFTVPVPSTRSCSEPRQLFVRVGAARTLEVSRPLDSGGCGESGKAGEVPGEVPCEGSVSRPEAVFQGASEDGSIVYFTTRASLVSSTDRDSANDLYMARIGCPPSHLGCSAAEREVLSLTQDSDGSSVGEAGEVQGVVRVSSDGSHVYFVARGVLPADAPSGEGVQETPVKGAENLYVYDATSGKVGFIGDICSDPGVSGVVPTGRCPSDLGSLATAGSTASDLKAGTGLLSESAPVQTVGGDGGMLILTTYARLIDSGPQADIDNAQDVYRYDAANGELLRVSVGEDRADANGNRADTGAVAALGIENSDAKIQPLIAGGGVLQEERKLLHQAASEDGSRIVFTSAEALSPRASNGLPDIYEWHDGNVSLISTGSSTEADESPVITPSGNDIFFVTAQGLVGQDSDGAPDIYDARIGDGFPEPAVQPRPCSGDACQGPLTNPAPLLVPGSLSQASGENLAALPAAKTVTPKKTTPKCAKPKKLSHGRCVRPKTRRKKRIKAKARKAGVNRGARS